MRAFIAGLVALCSIACADGGANESTRPGSLAVETDGGTDPDAGPEPEPCNWFVYWLTMVDRETVCNWGMKSLDPTVALFRTNGGECLAPVTVCGLALCSDLTYIREKQIVEVWGPAGLESGPVWAATETYSCEGEL